jgi:nucleoid-associated protein YgaU
MSDDQNKNSQPPEDTQWWEVPGRPSGESLEPDDEAALERLRALSAGTEEPGPPPEAKPRRGKDRGAVKGLSRPSSPRRRPAAAAGGGRAVARIAAPAVFLVAVIVLVALMFQSGVIGGQSGVAVTPTPKASSTKGGSPAPKGTTKVYVVKSGDTLSGIAVKFNTTIAVIEDLNPDMSSTTLSAGAKIKVPRQ